MLVKNAAGGSSSKTFSRTTGWILKFAVSTAAGIGFIHNFVPAPTVKMSKEERTGELLHSRRLAMRRNKTMMLKFRVPALVNRQLSYLSVMQCLGYVTIVCFLPYPRVMAAEKIDSIAEGFLRAGVIFLIVASGAGPLHRAWSDYQQMPRTPILGDPCGRLHRSFGVAESEPLSRGRTFVIDGAGVLRLQFMHDFTDHALAAIRQLVTKNRLSFAKSVPTLETMIGEAEHVI